MDDDNEKVWNGTGKSGEDLEVEWQRFMDQ